MNSIRSAFAFLSIVFFAAPATAKTVDQYGAVVFTQADVDAGGITPGDTPGFPASILVSGSYRLGSPLILTSLKNGIVISAPAVTLDLGGFKLSGAAVGRTGIVSQQIDTTISNGIVRGFTQYGIIGGGDNLTVNRMSVTNNSLGGLIYYPPFGRNTRISDSLFSDNGGPGIVCDYNCSIQNSTISYNRSTGIVFGGSSLALGNVVTRNAGYGITAPYPTGYGNNIIFSNSSGSVFGELVPLQPNACDPACVPSPP